MEIFHPSRWFCREDRNQIGIGVLKTAGIRSNLETT